ncbi:HAD-IB family hydrolase [Actinoplanes sp. NPDC023714]|uniref:HAD-IB family hydrolase n=1 Tax=Actinoplanes sp. NPDC023714 TaxID=3154322 RepID=UPI003406F01D
MDTLTPPCTDVTADELIAAIRTSPRGPRVGAFFDFDGTLVQGYTADALFHDQIRRGHLCGLHLARCVLAAGHSLLSGDPHRLGRAGFPALRGRTVASVTLEAQQLFASRIAGQIRPEVRDIVRAHRRQGHTVVVASAATRLQIEPAANDLGIAHLLCTELEDDDGVLTGRSPTGMLWGDPKAAAIRRFSRESGIDLRRSFAYGNGREDIAFLSAVGRPYATNPHPMLRRAAQDNAWSVLALREPPSAGLGAALGTIGALIGVNGALGAGVTYGWLTGDRRRGSNLGIGLAADLGLALAGVRLRVTGAENLETARPAVFVANHQSTLDVLVLGALLRHDFTAVAKQEARLDPRMLMISAFLEPAWIDRSDIRSARRTLDQAAQRIRAGTSVLVLPEGTRMPTPTLGRFKKGAFHLAMQAGVPIVPIVLRNTGELAWRRSLAVTPGTVDVVVLDPIETTGWTAAQLGERVAELRGRFADTLENWPEGGAGRHVPAAPPAVRDGAGTTGARPRRRDACYAGAAPTPASHARRRRGSATALR